MVEVPRPDFCFTSRSRNSRSSVSLIIANHLSGPRISRRRITFNRGSKSPTHGLGHFSAADYVASLPWLPRCTNGGICGPYCLLHSPRSLCTTGQRKRSLRRSAEALSRSSEQIGQMVEPRNDHRAYEDLLTRTRSQVKSCPRNHLKTPVRVAGVFVFREIAKILARSPRTSIFKSPA
jgi:hypothetical protein